jgi:hypothetical protein
MTIPDIGHCAGSGAEPAQGSIRVTGEGTSSGVCPACSGRFELHSNGVMALHDAAEIDQREVLDSPSPERSGTPVSEQT